MTAEGGAGHARWAIVSGQTFSIDGTCSNNAIETVDANETNAGTVHLSSVTCSETGGPRRGLQQDVHKPEPAWSTWTAAPAGPGRTITGNVTNNGNVNVNGSGSYSGGIWTNSGKLTIASGATLSSPASAGVTFTNTTGGNVVALGAGPALELGGGNTFNQGAGTTTGTEPVLLSGAVERYRNPLALHGHRHLDHHDLRHWHPGRDDVDGPGARHLGTCSNNADEVVDQPMTTTGTIDLSSVTCSNAATLAGKSAMGEDPLTVGAGGVLQTDSGAGNGGRTLDDDVTFSKGTFNVNTNTTYTAEKKGLTNKKGTITSQRITLTETAVTASVFSNKKGAIAGTGELLVEAPDTFAEGLGCITGVTVLVNGANLHYVTEVAPEGHGPGTIEVEGASHWSERLQRVRRSRVLGFCSLNAALTRAAASPITAPST